MAIISILGHPDGLAASTPRPGKRAPVHFSKTTTSFCFLKASGQLLTSVGRYACHQLASGTDRARITRRLSHFQTPKVATRSRDLRKQSGYGFVQASKVSLRSINLPSAGHAGI